MSGVGCCWKRVSAGTYHLLRSPRRVEIPATTNKSFLGGPVMAFTNVAKTQDVPPGQAKQVTINGCTVALFNVNGVYYAIDDTCTHRGGPLSEGQLDGTEVTCPWHGAKFDVTTGAHLSRPAPSGVKAYPVQLVG